MLPAKRRAKLREDYPDGSFVWFKWQTDDDYEVRAEVLDITDFDVTLRLGTGQVIRVDGNTKRLSKA